MSNHKKCFFTTNIADGLECSPKNNFDDYGFPKTPCPKYPCEKRKKIDRNIIISKSIHEINVVIHHIENKGYNSAIILCRTIANNFKELKNDI